MMRVERFGFTIALLAVAALTSARLDPRNAALKLYVTIQKQDWRSLYSMIAFSPKVKKGLKGPDAFAKEVNAGIGTGKGRQTVDLLFSQMRNMRTGGAVILGKKAVVRTFVDISTRNGVRHWMGQAHLVMDGGQWKWNLSYSDKIGPMISKSFLELIGKPYKLKSEKSDSALPYKGGH